MKYFIVDAFSDTLFKGNPAGVCLPDKPLSDEQMQSIAFENNLSETAFVSGQDGVYSLRWLTPSVEIDLCGHATLASTYVLSLLNPGIDSFVFQTKSGQLTVTRSGEEFFLDFPSRPPVPCDKPHTLEDALGVDVIETHSARDLLVVLKSQSAVLEVKPDFKLIKQMDVHGVIVTVKGNDVDFVSRFFAPSVGVNEDPVTGSAHCTLIPFWSKRLGKKEMTARQLSQRGGSLRCVDEGERVSIGGKAVLYLQGEIML